MASIPPNLKKGPAKGVEMFRGNSYQLRSDSLAIRTTGDGERRTATVPSGTTGVILQGPIGGRRLVEVDWNGENVLIFADDLQHSEESYCSDERRLRRGVGGRTCWNETNEREQALIEHSMDLAKSNEELERFAFVAAHDLREPLRSIQAMAEVFLERNGSMLDQESAQLLRFILKSAHRMRRLIKDLLDFATIGQEATTTRIETSAVVNLALRELHKAVEESRAIIEFGQLPPLDANEQQLTRLFQNLIGNAIKYRKDDPPKIRISASLVAGELVFSVSDNGIGIEPEYHEQIFAPFRRLHGASEYEGSGVGLAICQRIVAMHNGRIWVESEPGHGSKFCFTIPGAESSDVTCALPTVEETSIQSTTHTRTLAATG